MQRPTAFAGLVEHPNAYAEKTREQLVSHYREDVQAGRLTSVPTCSMPNDRKVAAKRRPMSFVCPGQRSPCLQPFVYRTCAKRRANLHKRPTLDVLFGTSSAVL